MSNVYGYSTDQFFGAGTAETLDGVNYYIAPNNNPPFIYPGRDIITQDGSGNVTRTALQRGYIRTLVNSIDGNKVGIRKCGFQFNPQILQANVSMNQNQYNAYQQDPTQLLVPNAGNSNFLFQLFFDRSMELNNRSFQNQSPTSLSPTAFVSAENTDIFSGDGALDPSVIGVFRDIGELNAIIGAGLSQDQVTYAQQVAAAQIQAGATALGVAINDQTVITATDNSNTFLSPANYGNSAFLNPRPVRVLFSSLFMVEGFVINIDINYTKFTTSLVPMQATVTLTMSAQYIGYAKSRTYATTSLANANQAYVSAQNSIQTDVNSLVAALQSSAGNIRAGMTIFNQSTGPSPVILGSPPPNGILQPTAGSGFAMQPFMEITGALNSSKSDLKTTDPVNAALSSDATFFETVAVAVYGPYATSPAHRGGATAVPELQVFGANYTATPTSWKDAATYSYSPNNAQPVVVGNAALNGTQWWAVNVLVGVIVTIEGQQVVGNGYTSIATKDLSTVIDFSVPMVWAGGAVQGATVSATSTSTSTTAATPSVTPANSATAALPPGSTSNIGTIILS